MKSWYFVLTQLNYAHLSYKCCVETFISKLSGKKTKTLGKSDNYSPKKYYLKKISSEKFLCIMFF